TDPRATHLPTLSLHDALPICVPGRNADPGHLAERIFDGGHVLVFDPLARDHTNRMRNLKYGYRLPGTGAGSGGRIGGALADHGRSEEHTSELQSRENLVCRLL